MTFTELARQLRKNQTDAERMLWQQLRKKQLLNYRFRRQFVIEPYIVDFICLDLKLIIELDGSQHSEQVDQDVERTLFLNQCGFKVVRYWDNEVLNNLEAVLESLYVIVEQCANDLKISPPNPPQQGRAR